MIPNYVKLSDYINNNIDNKDLYFDYFKWLKNRFSIDKSFGPSSEFVINLENYINFRFKTIYPNLKIILNSSNQNGESDIKIFKYISNLEDMSGDYCIHTTDSDLIHQILVQQVYYNLINKDITFTVVKYLKNYNNVGYAQILDASLIINNLMSYNSFIKNNIKIIWDLCFIFYLFGNDNLPSSLEIGPELGFDYFLSIHNSVLSNMTIIDIINDKITVDYNNLLLILKKFNEDKKKNITRIILQRYFKINLQLINLFIDDLKLDFYEILEALKYFIYYQRTKLSDEEYEELDEDDLRKTINMTDIDENIKNKLIQNETLIIENINYCNTEYIGLILYVKPINIINNDSYQDLYSYIIDKTNYEQSKLNPLLYDHIDLEFLQHLQYEYQFYI